MAAGRSFAVALLWALHPLRVESVAWVAERKDVLSTFFFIATLAAHVWYARRPGIERFAAVFALFIVALGAKPMVLTIPIALLLLDVWPLGRRDWTRMLLEKLVLAVPAGISSP